MAPNGWLLVSLPIFNILRKAGFGAVIEHPKTHERRTSVGAAFVDDTNMYNMARSLNTQEKTENEAGEQVKGWNNLLKVIGGQVKAPKSFWWILQQVKGVVNGCG